MWLECTRIAALAALAATLGCGNSTPTRVCSPGTTQGCLCPGNISGVQTCASDGNAWSACMGCATTRACTPGATQSCVCSGGGTGGSQTCLTDGSAFSACGGCST